MPPEVEVALAVLEHNGQWLLQLRDDIEGIVFPGTWALFGGHLEPQETPLQALRRELLEEIRWPAGDLPFWFSHRDARRIAHVFRAPLPVPLESLELREGQDMVLAGLDELRSGWIWSPRRQQSRPLAPSLQLVLREWERQG